MIQRWDNIKFGGRSCELKPRLLLFASAAFDKLYLEEINFFFRILTVLLSAEDCINWILEEFPRRLQETAKP